VGEAVSDLPEGFVLDVPGQRTPGNINLHNRPRVKNPDGSISTVRTISAGFPEGEVVIPTVSDDGRVLPDNEAIDAYRKSGKHLGIFDSPESATSYAQSLHDDQEREYVGGLPEGFEIDAPAAAPKMSLMDDLKRQAKLHLVRTPLEVAGAVPMMAADLGVGARNVIGNVANKALGREPTPDYEMPSQMYQQGLDSFLPKAETWQEKAATFGTGMVMGGKIPMPQVGKPVPGNFSANPMQSVRGGTLQNAQQAGYVVPPSTTNPSLLNRTLESIGGKEGTAQDAAFRNMDVTNSIARRALGMADDAPITPEALSTLRGQAAAPYKAVRGAGSITTTPKFNQALDAIEEPFKSAAKDFPDLADETVSKVIGGLRKESFDSASGVDAIARIREMSAKAYAGGDKAVGGALKKAAGALEDVIEENLAGRGKEGADMLKSFRDARQLIAKTYTVEKALNGSTGNVSAQKLGQQLARGKPLSGELKTAAQFGQAFPKAAREMLDSGSVRNTDVLAGGAAAVLQKEPSFLLYPFARQGARAALLSKQGQKLAQPKYTKGMPDWMLPGIFGGSAAQ
jgi:hypothetical protein